MIIVGILMVNCFYLKAYFHYKHLVIDREGVFFESIYSYSIDAKFKDLKRKSVTIFPILSPCSNQESRKAKTTGNYWVIAAYVLLIILILMSKNIETVQH